MKIRFEFVTFCFAIWLIILVASTVIMRSKQTIALSKYLISHPITDTNTTVDVRGTYDNMKNYRPWDRDFDKMVVYEKEE